jgi:hypothetical protein
MLWPILGGFGPERLHFDFLGLETTSTVLEWICHVSSPPPSTAIIRGGYDSDKVLNVRHDRDTKQMQTPTQVEGTSESGNHQTFSHTIFQDDVVTATAG